jgi:hypothetical protein
MPFRGVMVKEAVALDPTATVEIPEPEVSENDGDAEILRGTESVVVTEDVEAEVAVTATAYAPAVVEDVVFTWT